MFSKQKKEKRSFGVIGLGRFGTALALELANAEEELLVLDQNEDKIREIREITENAMVIKNLDKRTLEETGIQNCDVAVVCIGERMDLSLMTTMNLISMGIPTVIAKAASIEHGQILAKLGAQVVYPERDMAIRLARRLECSNTLDFIQLHEKIDVCKFTIPEKMVGRKVVEVDIRKKFGLNIIAIENNGTVLDQIRPDYEFCAGDIMYVVGNVRGMNQLTEWME